MQNAEKIPDVNNPDDYDLEQEQDGEIGMSDDDIQECVDRLHDLRSERTAINAKITAEIAKFDKSGIMKECFKFVEKVADYDQTKQQAAKRSLNRLWKTLIDDDQRDLFED